MRAGSMSTRILTTIASRRFGIGSRALHTIIGGNQEAMRVQVCRHVAKGYLRTEDRREGRQAHIEHMVYFITDKGKDALASHAIALSAESLEEPDDNTLEEPDEDADDYKHRPVNVAAAIKRNPNSVWDLVK